ncbi:MAG: sialate O-acetylesterase [Prevotellaceae bacterium]|nr:sialate O-acetylesterase [Prevotellaceae bacterium]
MNRLILTLSAICLMFANIQAKVKLPHLIGDNMVLQQNTDARLWGKATPGATVVVGVSWSSDTYRAVAGADGKWLLTVKTPEASMTPLSITFDDGDGKVTINNVLSGEVWVCAGQSNMEMPVKGFSNCPVEGYNNVVADAVNSSGIHYVKVPSVMSMTPLEDADCQWVTCNPNTVADASATGYFFARMVNRTLNIPVGIVEANKGGTRVESWLTKENLIKYTDEPLDSLKMVKKYSWDYHRPLLWGNGTFNPILNYTVKGILYYQGCSNVGDKGNTYSERLALLVKQWRESFKLGDIPFYFVQIAPYYYDDDINGTSGAFLREQQEKASKLIANSGMVCTNDCVYPWETQQIHPAQKQKVGERLAFLALNKTYDMKSIMCDNASFKSLRISNDTCYVRIKDDYNAISRYEDIQGFEVAGADKVFHKANAYYYWTKGIIITCPEVKKPVAVRYCFRNFQLGNVANKGGLPLLPFRTDNW